MHRLRKDLTSIQAEKIAKQMHLSTQLKSLYNTNAQKDRSRKWYIADLNAEAVESLELLDRSKTEMVYYLSNVFGRGFSERFLSNFFISDSFLISILRTLSWITPCPELSCILLDWSRTSPKAGGER